MRKLVFRYADNEGPDQPTQSDQDLRCPLIESLDTMKSTNGKQMTGWDFAHAWDVSKSMQFAHVRRHLFVWRGPYYQVKSSESIIINSVDIISKIIPVSILYKFKADRYRPVGVADGAITAAIDL